MYLRNLVAAATLLPILAVTGHAAQLQPIAAQPIQFGSISGSAYYTEDPDGYRVVATLSAGEETRPVRFETVLAPGQTVVLSAPGAVGTTPEKLEISRDADNVVIRQVSLTN
jgi:hypothetical protein